MKRFAKILSFASVAVLAATTAAHADTFDTFTEVAPGNGECCFKVVLDQKSSTDIGVTVSITSGTFFANTGSGQHPTFAYNLGSGLSGVTISGYDATHWTPGGSVVTGGPSFGTFSMQFNEGPGGGTSDGIASLLFDVKVSSGTIGFSDFIKNSDGYYFAADFLGSNGNTGLGAISDPGIPSGQTPEPSSLMLLGTGVLGAAGLLRRRITAANKA